MVIIITNAVMEGGIRCGWSGRIEAGEWMGTVNVAAGPTLLVWAFTTYLEGYDDGCGSLRLYDTGELDDRVRYVMKEQAHVFGASFKAQSR